MGQRWPRPDVFRPASPGIPSERSGHGARVSPIARLKAATATLVRWLTTGPARRPFLARRVQLRATSEDSRATPRTSWPPPTRWSRRSATRSCTGWRSLDEHGTVLTASAAWTPPRAGCGRSGRPAGHHRRRRRLRGLPPCRRNSEIGAGILAVIGGHAARISARNTSARAWARRWFEVDVTPVRAGGAVVAQRDHAP